VHYGGSTRSQTVWIPAPTQRHVTQLADVPAALARSRNMARRFGILPSYYRELLLGVAISLGVHVGLMGSYSLLQEKVDEVIQRITFEPPPPPSFFIKPPVASTKALEFRKVPVPQGYFLRERTQTTETRVAQIQALAALRTDAMLDQMEVADIAPSSMRGSGRLAVRRGVGAVAGGVPGLGLPEPALRIAAVQGVKEARNQVDMQLDMLSVRHMDTGQYQAMVVQDANDRRQVKGFLHIAQAYSTHHHGADSKDITLFQMDMLVKTLQEYTGIEADYRGAVPLDDPSILEIPWLMVTDLSARDIGDAELANLGAYLTGGGFSIMQIAASSGSEQTLKRKTGNFEVLRRAMRTQGLNEGADWRFVVLESDHPIYHSFFDFDTSVRYNQMSQHSSSNPLPFDLGLEIGDRLAVFLHAGKAMRKDTFGVGSIGEQSTHEVRADGTRALQFALNTVIFALTQEGSVTQQLMGAVR
jgi:hypothetical protein